MRAAALPNRSPWPSSPASSTILHDTSKGRKPPPYSPMEHPHGKDAINPSFTFVDAGSTTGDTDPVKGWVARDHLGIDQGPILAMLENQRTGLVWATMRKNPHIRRGLERAGFSGGWLDDTER